VGWNTQLSDSIFELKRSNLTVRVREVLAELNSKRSQKSLMFAKILGTLRNQMKQDLGNASASDHESHTISASILQQIRELKRLREYSKLTKNITSVMGQGQ
jgi:hypothetical protein